MAGLSHADAPPPPRPREYPDVDGGALGRFRLALHCGGCMIDAQKMRARIMDMQVRLAGRAHVCAYCGGCLRVRLLGQNSSLPTAPNPPPHPPTHTHQEAGVPVTNYGLFLSWVHHPQALTRCLEPWGLTL